MFFSLTIFRRTISQYLNDLWTAIAPVAVNSQSVTQYNSRPLALQKVSAESMDVDDYLNAVDAGDVNQVADYLSHRTFSCRPTDEAARDLALRRNHISIRTLIENKMREEAERQAKLFPNPLVSQRTRLYKRVTLDFDRNHHFSRLMLETKIDGTACLYICYRTQLQYPFLKDGLAKLGRNGCNGYVLFTYDINEQREEQILRHFESVLAFLIQLKKVDNSEISKDAFDAIKTGMATFFIDAKQKFPNQDCHLRQLDTKRWQYSHTYTDYQLYKAASECNSKEMLRLLQARANPNSRFDGRSIICIAAHLGSGHAFSGPDPSKFANNANEVLKIIKYLILYGADLSMEVSYGETLMEYLVRYYPNLNEPRIEQLYLAIINLLPAGKNSKKHIAVHEALQNSELAMKVANANALMLKNTKQIHYIKSVNNPSDMLLNLSVQIDDATALVSIELKEEEKISTKEKAELYEFFAKHCDMTGGMDKEGYFNWLMTNSGDNGKVLVDIIRHNGALQAIIISEVINTPIDGMNATIYHAKVAITPKPMDGEPLHQATNQYPLTQYPGLMKLLICLRGFSCNLIDDDFTNYTYYEAASARGFAISDIFERFPVYAILENIMYGLIKSVHSKDKVDIDKVNNCYYIKDFLDVASKEANPDISKPSVYRFTQEMYRDVYQRSGKVLAVAFLNNLENHQKFMDSYLPLIGSDHYSKMLMVYATQLQMLNLKTSYVNQRQNTSIRARL